MTNPEVSREPTPNGGDFSEMWYLDRTGNAVDDIKNATQFRLLEKKTDGTIINEILGLLDKRER